VVSAVALRILIRPEIFSNVLVVICLVLYLNAQKRFAVKEILAICLLLLFWTSYHNPIIGYIIIFGLFLEKAINKLLHKDESFNWFQWMLWGGIIFSIGFINLNLNRHSIVVPHFTVNIIGGMVDGFCQYIMEYNDTYLTHSTNVLTHVSWMLSVYAVIWSLIKRQYGFAFIVILLTFMSWSLVRLLAVVLVINMCVLALYWAQFVNTLHFRELRASVKNTMLIVSVCISLMTFYFLADKAQSGIKLNEYRLPVLEKRYPVQAADYLKNYQDGGNILNVLQYGGYLLYKLSPDYKVYFDGRSNILYPIEYVRHNVALWSSTNTVDDVVRQYDINYVVRTNEPETFASLKRTKTLELSFADSNFLLFSRAGEADFPLTSTLLAFPRCWNNEFFQDRLSQGVQDEIERSEKLFADKSYTIKIVLEFIKVYLSTSDKDEYLRNIHFEEKHPDGFRRLALHIAMKDAGAGADAVSEIFKSIEFKNNYDVLLYSYYLAKIGEYKDSENLAYYFYTLDEVGEVTATHDKFGILGRIFRILKENNQLQKFEASYVDELNANLEKVNYPFDRELSFDFMCK
ncbi:MAG: hypothetical protein KAI17_03995, partial [Thiotrichaceae bacterium]|nr:hypothetical protein [Thiotrichaceae bacterium]